MHPLHSLIRPVAALAVISLLALTAGCSKPGDTGTAGTYKTCVQLTR